MPQYAQVVQSSAREIGVDIELVDPGPVDLLRRRCVRLLALARLDHEPRRLRSPRRAERAARRTAPLGRHVERRALQEPASTTISSGSSSRRRTSGPAGIAGQIQTLLLDETPIIFAYFYNLLSATAEQRQRASCRPRSTTCSSTAPRSPDDLGRNTRAPGGDRAPARPLATAMLRFLARRLALAIVTLWLLSVIVFVGAQVLPGNPGRAILGPFADDAAVEQLNQELGFDQPAADALLGLARRASSRATSAPRTCTRRPCLDFIGDALLNSFKLAAGRARASSSR